MKTDVAFPLDRRCIPPTAESEYQVILTQVPLERAERDTAYLEGHIVDAIEC